MDYAVIDSCEELSVAIDDHVAILTLNRPQRLNAYTPDMGQELMTTMRQLLKDSDVHALILTGSGRGFCAGADREFLDGKRGRNGYALGEEPFINEFAAELAYAAKPLIGAVNGPAFGIGATMLLPFDMRIASSSASFGFPFVKLNIVPGLGCSYFLPRLVGAATAREIILTGATVDAQRALQIGLVNEVVEPEQLLPRAIEIARLMGRHHSQVVQSCKRVLNLGANGSLPEAMACERQESARLRNLQIAAAGAGQ
jgi:enoyl-CoA hydratase/carnithine racemase